MRVSDFMIPTGELHASASLRRAAMSMRKGGIDCLPVTDRNHRFVGLLTADAVAGATAADRRDPSRTRAHRVMTTDCCQCYADEDVEAALSTMTTRQVRRSVVLDRDEHPIGILALGNLPTRRGLSAIEAIMDCDRLEQRWIGTAGAASRGPGRLPNQVADRRGRTAYVVQTSAPGTGDIDDRQPARGTGGRSRQPLPVTAFIEAYFEYHR
jgi:hypothetical protein